MSNPVLKQNQLRSSPWRRSGQSFSRSSCAVEGNVDVGDSRLDCQEQLWIRPRISRGSQAISTHNYVIKGSDHDRADFPSSLDIKEFKTDSPVKRAFMQNKLQIYVEPSVTWLNELRLKLSFSLMQNNKREEPEMFDVSSAIVSVLQCSQISCCVSPEKTLAASMKQHTHNDLAWTAGSWWSD